MNIKKIIEFFSNPKRLLTFLIFSNIAVLVISLLVLQPSVAKAAEAEPTVAWEGLMAAAVAVVGSGFAAALAVHGAATAGSAAMAERPGLSIWVIVLAGLGEGIAIYGLIVAILIVGAI